MKTEENKKEKAHGVTRSGGWFTDDHVSCSSRAGSLPRESSLFCKHTNAAFAADARLNIYEP